MAAESRISWQKELMAQNGYYNNTEPIGMEKPITHN
jgi:hypothetical protein